MRSPAIANITPVGNGPFGVRPRLRGLDSTRLLVLVDGERLNTARQATDRTGAEVGLFRADTISRLEDREWRRHGAVRIDALAGTINIITSEPRVLVGSRSWHLRPERRSTARTKTGAAARSVAGVSHAALRGPRAGGRRAVRQLPRGQLRRRGHEPVVRVRRTPPRRHDRRRVRVHASRRFRIRSMRRTSAPTTLIPNSQAKGTSSTPPAWCSSRRGHTLRLRYQQPRMEDIGFADFADPVLLQRHVTAVQQPRSRLRALRGAGAHAVARQPVGLRLLPADRPAAEESAAGPVPGADADGVFPDRRDAPRHRVGNRAARLDARMSTCRRRSCPRRSICSRPASPSIAIAAATSGPR